ncbi:oxygenase MpaB family protein [Nocardioides sp. R-C-SC26]|uniref:oxygenase MpaB family protein n=1 Tax=Nocardioides sp. R-C-SC26 TaxID=2870414 RepID=UPI001E2BB599|nr:oxygenase MpaB family protein [Nocardioides sp. R-C-SC26]
MNAAPQPTASTDVASAPYPSRHREAEARGRRLGRPLRAVARVSEVDEELMHRIGLAFTTCDQPGARLAHAMRSRAGEPGRVTMDQFRSALRDGVTADSPPALREFFDVVEATPSWVDPDLLARGQRVYHRFGQNAGDVLQQLSLIGGYRFGGPTDLLVATGGLTGDMTVRRLAETQYWATTLSVPGGLERGGEAWRLTVHVRAMHALVNESFTPQWDVARWGLPINNADQAATLGLFDGVLLIGARALGVPVSRDDSRAVMHLWKYVGWLMGVEEEFLVDSERERHRLNYHLLLAQADLSDAGPQLAQAIVDAQRRLHYENLGRLRGRYQRERLLSMLTVFLGPHSMRELGLPRRPPWAHLAVGLANTWRYRTPWGRRGLDDWGDRIRARIMRRYFGVGSRDVAHLKLTP